MLSKTQNIYALGLVSVVPKTKQFIHWFVPIPKEKHNMERAKEARAPYSKSGKVNNPYKSASKMKDLCC